MYPFNRQSVADRKRFGGIKFGEMQRDCLIYSYGTLFSMGINLKFLSKNFFELSM